MTERLFETDSHLKLFYAKVLLCEKTEKTYKDKKGYKIVLDKTAFFPEGGGQKGDSGYIASGEKNEDDFFVFGEKVVETDEAEKTEKEENSESNILKQKRFSEIKKVSPDVFAVFDTVEKDGIIYHYCSSPLNVGDVVTGLIDYDLRFRRMQNHTGEHIISGIINKYFGYDNVGFHMGSDDVTLDINGALTKEEIEFVEKTANIAVVENVNVYAEVFSGDALEKLEYRSKLDLKENVRIVTVDGFDKCACCAPHVSKTGEIGIIKITGFMNYKQGMRLHMLCGFDALADYENKLSQTKNVSALLSVKPNELALGVSRLLEENKKEKQESNTLKNKIATLLLEKAEIEKTPCLFTDINDNVFMRYLATGGADIFGIFGVFCIVSENNYRYVCVGKNIENKNAKRCDMRTFAKELNSALNGRGGGDAELIQGSVKATESEIKAFFSGYSI